MVEYLKVQLTYWPPQISQKKGRACLRILNSRADGGQSSMLMHPLLSLLVEHLKVMAALTVEPAYASSPYQSSPLKGPYKSSLLTHPHLIRFKDHKQSYVQHAPKRTLSLWRTPQWNRDTESNPAKVLTKKRRSDSNRDLPP